MPLVFSAETASWNWLQMRRSRDSDGSWTTQHFIIGQYNISSLDNTTSISGVD